MFCRVLPRVEESHRFCVKSLGAGSRAVFFQEELVRRWWAQRPDQILAFEHHSQPVKWGRIVQNGLPRTGGKPPVGRIHFVQSVPILQVVNGVQMLKFDLGAAPTDFSPSPPGRKVRGTQRPGTFLKNGHFPQPVVTGTWFSNKTPLQI